MTDPTPMPGSQPGLPEVNVVTSISQTPVGAIGAVTLAIGTTQFMFLVDERQAATLAQLAPGLLTELAARLRRARLGLFVPEPGQPMPRTPWRAPVRPTSKAIAI